jgi:sodium-dependent dicarboxylate transporter 2/3/5
LGGILVQRNAETLEQTPVPGRFAYAGIVGALIAAFAIIFAPTPAGLSLAGQHMAALFAVALILWVTEALPIAVTAVLVLMLQPMFGVADIGTAFSSFVSPVFFFVLVMFLIAQAFSSTGLAHRFALWLLSVGGTETKRVIRVFVIGPGIISMIMSDVPACAVFMAIALGIFNERGLNPGSRFAKALMIGIPVGALIGGVGTPAGSSINLLGIDQLAEFGQVNVRFLDWMTIGVPMVLIMLPLAAWTLTLFFKPEINSIGEIHEIEAERRAQGSISSKEWKVLIILGIMIVLWILSTWYPVLNVYAVGIAGAAVLFLPGVNILDWKQAQASTGWDALLLIGGVTSLGRASVSTGLAQWLVEGSVGGIHDWPAVAVVALISAFTVVIHLILPINPVIVTVLIPPLALLAKSTGVNPALYALPVAFTASCAFLLPMDAVPLVTFGKGYYKMFDMLPPGSVLSVLWVILMTLLLIAIGPMLGYF